MSDVFVSYKAEDRRRVQPLVEALQADGLSVWWDAQIGGGHAWRESIERQLDAAKCVIVIWSKRSCSPEGRFVRDEASRAQQRGAYLPVLIDKVQPPLGFGESQTISLISWKGDRFDPRYGAVLDAARSIISGTPFEGHALPPVRHGVSRRAVIASGAVAAAAVGIGGWLLLKPDSAAASDSIAVLPFANLSGDPAQAYFSDGIAEEIRTALSRIAQLRVVARTSSELVRDADAKTAARKLGVSNIITGSVRRSPSTIRVAAQLINGENGIERWTQVYDRPTGDVLQIQSDIAASVAQSLSIELGQATRAALMSGGTQNPEALDLFLRADVSRIEGGEAGYRKAISLIDTAIALDPGYAEAHARKGILLNFLAGGYARSASERRTGLERAAANASRAIQLAPDLPYGYLILAAIQVNQLDFAQALKNFERGRQLPGVRHFALRGYALLLSRLKRHDEASRVASSLVPLDPLNAASYYIEAIVLYEARRYRQAIRSARRSLELAPALTVARNTLAYALLMTGETDEAQRQFALMPQGDVYRLIGEAMVAARRGDKRESTLMTAELMRRYGDAVHYQVAEIHAQRGEKEEAIAALNRAWETRDPGLAIVQVDPFLDPIRHDPRFAVVVRRLNFPS